jgi:TolB-like protein/Tfp pilus assembly protein PilF
MSQVGQANGLNLKDLAGGYNIPCNGIHRAKHMTAKIQPQSSKLVSELASEVRLESWKEIANYLNRNVRTAQRWERLERLPVRRHKHVKHESVYAYKHEIDAWREQRQPLQEWLSAAESAGDGKLRLAVLPFQNLFEDSEEDYFADGLTEEMITQLGRTHPNELGVIARTSVMQYKGTEKSIEQIGKELRVDAVLEGSVRRAGDRLRISAQLIRVRDQSHLWAETYDRPAKDVLEIQTNVAEQIARSLELQLLPKHTAEAPAKPHKPDSAAHDAYLRGRYFWNRRSEPEFFRAIEYFKKAVEIDPKYARAYSGLADIYNTLGWYGVLTGKEALERADSFSRKALAIDGALAEAHTSLAFALHSYGWDWAGSEGEHVKALELDPNYVTAHLWYAFFLMAMGRLDEAEQQMKQALALDPLSLVQNSYYGWVLYFARKYEEAAEQILRTLDMDPKFLIAHFILGLVYAQQGKARQSIREYELAREITGENALVLSGLAHVCGLAGKRTQGRGYIEKLKQLSKRQHVSPYRIAYGYATCGSREEALLEIEKAFAQRESWLPLLRVEPGLDALRSDARFQEMLMRMKFPEAPAADSAAKAARKQAAALGPAPLMK